MTLETLNFGIYHMYQHGYCFPRDCQNLRAIRHAHLPQLQVHNPVTMPGNSSLTAKHEGQYRRPLRML